MTEQHKVEREWILAVLGDGMRDKHCYELYDYQRIFMVIMAFYNSPLSDETSQVRSQICYPALKISTCVK